MYNDAKNDLLARKIALILGFFYICLKTRATAPKFDGRVKFHYWVANIKKRPRWGKTYTNSMQACAWCEYVYIVPACTCTRNKKLCVMLALLCSKRSRDNVRAAHISARSLSTLVWVTLVVVLIITITMIKSLCMGSSLYLHLCLSSSILFFAFCVTDLPTNPVDFENLIAPIREQFFWNTCHISMFVELVITYKMQVITSSTEFNKRHQVYHCNIKIRKLITFDFW